MKRAILLLFAEAFPRFAHAQEFGGETGGNLFLAIVFGLIYFIVLSAIFSIIFWLVYRWINKK